MKLIEQHIHPTTGVKTLTYDDHQEVYDKDGTLIANVDPEGKDLMKKEDEPLLAETSEPVTPSGTPAFTGEPETGNTPSTTVVTSIAPDPEEKPE